MRLWSLHPKYLDAAGMNACWREGLLARNVLLGNTKGYISHPQLIRFRETSNPLYYIDAFLTEIYNEAARRNFSYNKDKIHVIEDIAKMRVTTGQLAYEYQHLKRKLEKRAPQRLIDMPMAGEVEPHPLFEIIEGDIEKWEIIQSDPPENLPIPVP